MVLLSRILLPSSLTRISNLELVEKSVGGEDGNNTGSWKAKEDFLSSGSVPFLFFASAIAVNGGAVRLMDTGGVLSSGPFAAVDPAGNAYQ